MPPPGIVHRCPQCFLEGSLVKDRQRHHRGFLSGRIWTFPFYDFGFTPTAGKISIIKVGQVPGYGRVRKIQLWDSIALTNQPNVYVPICGPGPDVGPYVDSDYENDLIMANFYQDFEATGTGFTVAAPNLTIDIELGYLLPMINAYLGLRIQSPSGASCNLGGYFSVEEVLM